MPHQTLSTSLQGWYTAPDSPPQTPPDIAREAFAEATEQFKQLTRNNTKREWIDQLTSMDDVQRILHETQRQYSGMAKKDTETRSLAERVSRHLLLYSPVIDMFVQSHPEYAAIGWGIMKYLLMVFLEHTTMFTHVADALDVIGDALRLGDLSAELYRTAITRDLLAELYAHIMRFLIQITKWCTMSPTERIVSAAALKTLKYKDTKQKVVGIVERLCRMAQASERAEIRGITVSQNSMQSQLVQMQGDVGACKGQLLDIRYASILDELRCDGDTVQQLDMCRSLAKHRNLWQRADSDSATARDVVTRWIVPDQSTLLVFYGTRQAEAKIKDLVINTIDHIQSLPRFKDFKMIWRLSAEDPSIEMSSMVAIWRSLVSQLLRQDINLFAASADQLHVTHFKTERAEAEWLAFFASIVSKLPKCVIAVDASTLFKHFDDNPKWIADFIQQFQKFVDDATKQENELKVLVTCYCADRSALQSLPKSENRLVNFIFRRPGPLGGRPGKIQQRQAAGRIRMNRGV